MKNLLISEWLTSVTCLFLVDCSLVGDCDLVAYVTHNNAHVLSNLTLPEASGQNGGKMVYKVEFVTPSVGVYRVVITCAGINVPGPTFNPHTVSPVVIKLV